MSNGATGLETQVCAIRLGWEMAGAQPTTSPAPPVPSQHGGLSKARRRIF